AAVVFVREGDAEAPVPPGQLRPSVRTSPRVEAPRVHDQPREGGAVPAQVLGRGVYDHVGTVLAGAVQGGTGQGGVDDHGHVVGVGDGAERGQVQQLRAGVGDRLDDRAPGV